MTHSFSNVILEILRGHFGAHADEVCESPLVRYLDIKTRSANRGSKSRGSFANHYALYVLVEDYINKGYADKRKGEYEKYEGARFTDLFLRQTELPFGRKLQNHALNSRLNDEFRKYFQALDTVPILRDQKEQRYWINERLLKANVMEGGVEITLNLAGAIIEIIDTYVAARKSAFEGFLETCKQISSISVSASSEALAFVNLQLDPSVDARVFKIISFAILKAHYGEQSIFWGWTRDDVQQDFLLLYKTGRTIANDGGIDFVMKPLGRFFQVTETIDVNKYFLDIDKIQRFPLTFVVKTDDSSEAVLGQLRNQAKRKYGVDAIVDRYLESVEEIINIPELKRMFSVLAAAGRLPDVMSEVVAQSRVEFNYEEPDDDEEEE